MLPVQAAGSIMLQIISLYRWSFNGRQRVPACGLRTTEHSGFPWPFVDYSNAGMATRLSRPERSGYLDWWCWTRYMCVSHPGGPAVEGLRRTLNNWDPSSCNRTCVKADKSHLSPTPRKIFPHSDPDTLHLFVTCTKYIMFGHAGWVFLSVRVFVSKTTQRIWMNSSTIGKAVALLICIPETPGCNLGQHANLNSNVCCGVLQTLQENAGTMS
jgi:hypothetical protein